MKKYKVITIDLFQTLVNVESRSDIIWHRILREDESNEMHFLMKKRAKETLVEAFHQQHALNANFKTLREIFTGCFEQLFLSEKLIYDPKIACDIFINEHNKSTWYHDSIPFIKKVKKHAIVCLLSDADNDMIKDLLVDELFHDVIISEDVHSYKAHSSGKMFYEVMKRWGCQPEEMLHIGDASSDIIGASRLNIDTCWIRRVYQKRSFDVEPTYTVTNLEALDRLLFEGRKE